MWLIGTSTAHWLHRRAEVNLQQQNKSSVPLATKSGWLQYQLFREQNQVLPRDGKEDQDPPAWPPVSTGVVRQKMAHKKQSEGKEIGLLPFHRQGTQSLREKLSASARGEPQQWKQLLFVAKLNAERHCATDIS